MEQRTRTAAGGTTGGDGTTVEFETDVVQLLVAATRSASRQDAPVVGSEHLLSALVMGDSDAGAALAPGMRKAGALSGLVAGRGGEGWVSADDDEGQPPVPDDDEIGYVWRETRWRFALSHPKEAGKLPAAMSGALRRCLRLALDTARAEGTVSVRCRQVAQALLDLPESRAREALLLRRTDLAAAATALAATAAEDPAEAPSVTLLRRAGTLGRSGNALSRALTSWLSGSQPYGSPVVFAVSIEARRQAVRCGRPAAEPIDLLLGALALKRALDVAGLALPDSLADVNSAAGLLRRHGVRQDSLARSSITSPAAHGTGDEMRFSEAAELAKSVAQLRSAEGGSATVGTVHLLAAVLEGDSGEVARLLEAEGVDVEALRSELSATPAKR
ncbi:Clp protease N-terminal domain-containing protein [Streptomyces sp. DSM 41014]|uniref:Clp protease N-terminal domain-containing protein n=1 Tax=Streptomyces hintoniae TaxID=3075521 RepID=A0ABU2UM63_9ACTN|nr:Clp protease N-terminal domain-containing protein [Streptomyces sp. DSM 41014]MDT0474365.1 Clp protease N-terminal domain-containing protein [Streptomyces sp. DSM 41014]